MDGKCEVNHDNPCAWIEIYNKLNKLGKLDKLEKMYEPKGYKDTAYPRVINLRAVSYTHLDVYKRQRLFPVKSSAPHNITSINPTGNKAAPKNLPKPDNCSPNAELIVIKPVAPSEIYIPARIARSKVLSTLKCAFLAPLSTHAALISDGVLNILFILLFN